MKIVPTLHPDTHGRVRAEGRCAELQSRVDRLEVELDVARKASGEWWCDGESVDRTIRRMLREIDRAHDEYAGLVAKICAGL